MFAIGIHAQAYAAGSAKPDWRLALDDFQKAIDLFGNIGARPDQARATHAYANALEAAGDKEASAAQLAVATAMFRDMGISPDRTPA